MKLKSFGLKPHSLINGKFIAENYIQLDNEILQTCKASYNQNVVSLRLFIIAVSACGTIIQKGA